MMNLMNGYSKFREAVFPAHKALFEGLDESSGEFRPIDSFEAVN